MSSFIYEESFLCLPSIDLNVVDPRNRLGLIPS